MKIVNKINYWWCRFYKLRHLLSFTGRVCHIYCLICCGLFREGFQGSIFCRKYGCYVGS